MNPWTVGQQSGDFLLLEGPSLPPIIFSLAAGAPGGGGGGGGEFRIWAWY